MNTLLPLQGILSWIVGSIAVALAGLYLKRSLFKSIDVRANAEFLTGAVTIVGTLVSVVLGMLVSSSVDQYRDLERNVDSEAAGVADVFRFARALPEKSGSPLQDLCISYCNSMVTDEWPAMKQGQPSAAVTLISAKIYDAILDIHPTDFQSANVQRALLESARLVGDNRETRIALVRSTWTWKLLPIILLCGLLVLAISYLYVDQKPPKLHAVLISFVAIALGANIGLLVVMSRPFDNGSCGILPDAFELTATAMKAHKSRP